MLPPIKTVLAGFQKEELAAIREEIDGLEDIYQLIDEAIVEEPPISIREGGMIKDQFDETIDHLRAAKHDGKQWLVQLVFCRCSAAGLQARDTFRDILSKIDLNILTSQIRAAYTKHTVDVPDLTFSRNASNIEIVKILQRIADICIRENIPVYSNIFFRTHNRPLQSI